MSAFSAAAQDEDGDIISALRARVADLEAQLYAVGAGGVGNMEQPQCVDWPEVDRLLKTVKYLIGIAERGSGRKMRNDDETVECLCLCRRYAFGRGGAGPGDGAGLAPVTAFR